MIRTASGVIPSTTPRVLQYRYLLLSEVCGNDDLVYLYNKENLRHFYPGF